MMESLKQTVAYIRSDKNVAFAVLGVGLTIGVAALGFGFYWYRWNREHQAVEAWVNAFSSVEEARNKKTPQAWQEVEVAFSHGFEQYKSSATAGYFLIYQAQALLQQNKHEQACEVLAEALQYIPRTSYLYHSYAVKLARMQIDASDSTLQQQGEQTLKELSEDPENPLRDMALYYYGLLYFYGHQNREAAQTIWNTLLTEYSTQAEDAYTYSPWVEKAQAKLNYSE